MPYLCPAQGYNPELVGLQEAADTGTQPAGAIVT